MLSLTSGVFSARAVRVQRVPRRGVGVHAPRRRGSSCAAAAGIAVGSVAARRSGGAPRRSPPRRRARPASSMSCVRRIATVSSSPARAVQPDAREHRRKARDREGAECALALAVARVVTRRACAASRRRSPHTCGSASTGVASASSSTSVDAGCRPARPSAQVSASMPSWSIAGRRARSASRGAELLPAHTACGSSRSGRR